MAAAAPTKWSLSNDDDDDDNSDHDHPYLPDDILDHMILPRLPFKSLKRFQCVSKRRRSLIGRDALFPSDQARLLSPSSTDLVFLGGGDGHRLSVLIDPQSVGVPDPSLQFLNCSSDHFLLIRSSANGLLLLYAYLELEIQWLCLCNPATQEKQLVPTDGLMLEDLTYLRDTGLAFDPTIIPNRYILVNAYPDSGSNDPDRGRYRFHIFQSDTGKWRTSNKRQHVQGGGNLLSLKVVYTQGVIYWHFPNYILWYNTQNDLPGSVPLPTTGELQYWSMGICADRVVCCHTWDAGVEVWTLTNGTCWDRLHFISWDSIPLQINHALFKKAHSEQHITIYKSRYSRPLAFDGHFVYLLDYQKRFAQLEAYTETGSYDKIGENTDILAYSICTQQLEKKGGYFSRIFEDDLQAYDYRNSMAPLPKILQ